MEKAVREALAGSEVAVDPKAIEKSLADLWRAEGSGVAAVTKAALWNVLAHTSNEDDRRFAAETLSVASAAVPQRTIIIHSSPELESDFRSWISANCHVTNGKKQVCSEEIWIVAGGERVRHVPPAVEALLLPEMPVAAWWLGDLPDDHHYVNALLDPVDRLVVDSSHFDSPDDLKLLTSIATESNTHPADLNWARLEPWRIATASLFDHPDMRARLRSIETVKVVNAGSSRNVFGEVAESLLYLAWLTAQAGQDVFEDGVRGAEGEIRHELRSIEQPNDAGSVQRVEISFRDEAAMVIELVSGGTSLRAAIVGREHESSTITRCTDKTTPSLIVRQLSQQDDQVFKRILPISQKIGRRLRQ